MEAGSGRILGEVISEDGISRVFDEWTRLPERPARLGFFQKRLAESIIKLETQCDIPSEGLTLIVSGMASSSIGMEELPYTPLPITLSEMALPKKFFPADKIFPYNTLLISGLRTDNDVMRGEETELIGLVEGGNNASGDRVYIFPGTHSKHIKVENNRITDFHTFMTGEFFDLFTSHSTLKASLKKPERFSEEYHEAFARGIQFSQERNFLSGAFMTRTNQLLGKLDPFQNFYYLSGLIIGLELSDAKEYTDIVICAASKFIEPYKLGVKELGLSARCQFIPSAEVARLVCKGHQKIYENWNFNDQS